MTKKAEVKAKVKGADAEQKILKKIQDGNSKAQKEGKFNKRDKENSKNGVLGKRTHGEKNGVAFGKPK